MIKKSQLHQNDIFLQLLQANLSELILLERELGNDSLEKAYCTILISYFQCDLVGLEKALQVLSEIQSSNSAQEVLLAISQLRLAIRKREINYSQVEKVLSCASKNISPLFSGEAHFVIALAFDVLKDHENCLEVNIKAHHLLQEAGAYRKSILALQNSVAAKSRLHPTANLLLEYYQVYRLARKNKIRSVAGVALMNIAREYQLMGALESALKIISKSLLSLRGDEGTMQYYLALLNRAHIFAELGRHSDAQLDFEAASLAEFPEIRAGLKVLRHILGQNFHSLEDKKDLTASWAERLQKVIGSIQREVKLSVQEDQLVRILAQGKRTKAELIQELFCGRIPHEHAANRLKSLLARINRKIPKLIRSADGYVSLAEDFERGVA